MLQETCLFNLDWFVQPFMQQVIIYVLFKFSLPSYDLNTVCMIRMQKHLHHIWNWLKSFKEFLASFVLAFYAFTRLLYLEMSWKKLKLKLLRTWCYTQVVTFWLCLEKVIFKLESDVISGMNTDPLWRWKSGVFLQSTGSKNLRTLPLNKAKSMKHS